MASGAYEKMLQRVALPVATFAARRHFWKIHSELQASQWHTREAIEEKQLQKLQKLVRHAYATVPLYKEKMDAAKIKPEDIQTLADIRKLPIITKADFRQGYPERCTSSAIHKKTWMPDSTSGSTGSPFQFIRDKHFSDTALANTYRNYTWTGAHIGNRMAVLWGYHTSSAPVKLLDTMLRRKFYSSFDVETQYATYYEDMLRYKPALIEAYAASLTHYAKLLKEHKLTGLHVPAAISSAETLYPEHRKLIEEALHTTVFNRYGSRELGGVAQECEAHTGLHINAETYIVEVVKKKAGDKLGRIVVTNLSNFTMPFIRYDTEDYGLLATKQCTCGRGLPMLASVEGRVSDFIVLANGDELSFLFFNYFFEQYGAYIKQFQVIQDKKNHLLIRLVVTDKYTAQKEKDVLTGIKKKVGAMQITIEKVPSIATEKSGKLRPVKRLV